MKNYLKIPEHGLHGEFYRCGEYVFRADNLETATMIAANHWLFEFVPLHEFCTLDYCEPGEFQFIVSTHSRCGGFITGSYTVTLAVEYHGPADMFSPVYQLNHCHDPVIAEFIGLMEDALIDGNPAVRRSNASGRVMFTCKFPRYRENGEWWSREHNYLSTDPAFAAEQMRHVNLI